MQNIGMFTTTIHPKVQFWKHNKEKCRKVICHCEWFLILNYFGNFSYVYEDEILFYCSPGYETADENPLKASCNVDNLDPETFEIGCEENTRTIQKLTHAEWSSVLTILLLIYRTVNS